MLKMDAIFPVGKRLENCNVVVLALTVLFKLRINLNLFPQKL